MAINPVGTWNDQDFQTMSGTLYKTSLDNNVAVGKRIVDAFAPHAKTIADMNVLIDAGMVYNDLILTEKAQQTVGPFTAPVVNPRIDRIVINSIDGTAVRIAGSEALSPTPPAITGEVSPCCQVRLTVGMSAITNAQITDERLGGGGGGQVVVKLKSAINQTIAYGTGAETPITAMTKTIPGGMLGTNNWYHAFADFAGYSLASGGTMEVRLRYGASQVAIISVPGPDSGAGVFEFLLRNDGSANSQFGYVRSGGYFASGTASVDSTIDQTFTASIRFVIDTGATVTIHGQRALKYS